MSNMNMPGNLPQLPNVVDEPGQAQDLSQTAPMPASAPDASSAQASGAQDADTIEEVWVHRVERLLHEYGDDPQKLGEQFSQLKTEYIAKRYGKQIGKAHVQD